MSLALIVYARYPEPGKCKTRLIGDLGAESAAELQRRMTSHALDWARKVASQCADDALWAVGAGGSEVQFQALYGQDLCFHVPAADDLGLAMAASVREAIGKKFQHVLIAGSDAPELGEMHCDLAKRNLVDHDVVLVPAHDGGYALIGIAARAWKSRPELSVALFENIAWSTDRVLEQTVRNLVEKQFKVALLPMVHDVDRAEDVPRAERALQGVQPVEPRISVIIPSFNREPELPRAIASARGLDSEASNDGSQTTDARMAEVLVLASGEANETAMAAVAGKSQLRMLTPGRAQQLNRGASEARGGVLLFLHADSRLPPGFVTMIDQALASDESNVRKVVGGAFELSIDAPGWSLRFLELCVALRSRCLRLPYGDQAIFVCRKFFEQLGGFQEMPIMEDYEFVRRLQRLGNLTILQASVLTSARRWQRVGVFKTTVINQLMLAAYHVGVPVERLARLYRGRAK